MSAVWGEYAIGLSVKVIQLGFMERVTVLHTLPAHEPAFLKLNEYPRALERKQTQMPVRKLADTLNIKQAPTTVNTTEMWYPICPKQFSTSDSAAMACLVILALCTLNKKSNISYLPCFIQKTEELSYTADSVERMWIDR